MKGYIKQTLEDLKSIMIVQHHYAPSSTKRPDYGAKVQYTKDNISPPLTAIQIKHIEHIVGKILCYSREIGSTQCYTP